MSQDRVRAMPVAPHLIGVDASKATLAICQAPHQPVLTLANTLAQWLKSLPPATACLAVEATNPFHLGLAVRVRDSGPLRGRRKLARKLARIAFALLKQQVDYQPQSPANACTGTWNLLHGDAHA